MSGATGLDIRVPIGGLFSGLGLLLTGYGLATAGQHERYAVSAGVNVNLWWGLAMLAFGVALLVVATRSRRASVRPADESAEGRATEARERARGLEH
jgi:hypothetical protein